MFFLSCDSFLVVGNSWRNARHANGKRKHQTSRSIISGAEFDQGFFIVDSGINEGSDGILLLCSTRHLLAFLIKKFS
jgi:hypothetical protein